MKFFKELKRSYTNLVGSNPNVTNFESFRTSISVLLTNQNQTSNLPPSPKSWDFKHIIFKSNTVQRGTHRKVRLYVQYSIVFQEIENLSRILFCRRFINLAIVLLLLRNLHRRPEATFQLKEMARKYLVFRSTSRLLTMMAIQYLRISVFENIQIRPSFFYAFQFRPKIIIFIKILCIQVRQIISILHFLH